MNAETETPVTDILDVKISAINMESAVATIEGWIDRSEPNYVCVCTVHTIMECQRDPDLKDVVNAAGLRTPDGMPLVWLSRRAGNPHVSRVYGPDLMLELASRSASKGHRHFFYGGRAGVPELLAQRLSERFPGLHIAGTHEPSIQEVGSIETDQNIRRINESEADVVWIGLGTPKQDWWIANHRSLLHAPVLIAVGAAFDFHSGRTRQAPTWMQQRGLEWLFRFSQDPRRLWRRYVVDNTRFIVRVGQAKLTRLKPERQK